MGRRTGPNRPEASTSGANAVSRAQALQLVIDTRRPNATCRGLAFGMDTVAKAAVVAEKTIHVGGYS